MSNWWQNRKFVGGRTLPDHQEWLDRMAVRGLYRIILTALLSITVLSLWNVSLRYGLFSGTGREVVGGTADEALSILGNIASASVGGLVGWLTRSLVDSRQIPPPSSPPVEEVSSPVDEEDTR